MPSKPQTPCSHPGCARAAVRGGRCEEHAVEAEARRSARMVENDRARGSAAERGYDRHWRIVRAAYLKRHPRCVGCGAVATDVDHVVPKALGGGNEWANLQALCHRCHSAKTMRQSVPREGRSTSLGEIGQETAPQNELAHPRNGNRG